MEHDLRTKNKEEEFKEIPIINDTTISILFKEEKKYTRGEVEELCGKAFDAGEAYRTGSYYLFKQIHPDKHEWIKRNLK